jgi:hypothetical protein
MPVDVINALAELAPEVDELAGDELPVPETAELICRS